MTSTLGGDDPAHDLPDAVKDKEEARLRKEARALLSGKQRQERARKLSRATEISRRKGRRAHKGTD
jgi:hypothetical protein